MTDLEQLRNLADCAIEMEKAGLVRKLTKAEQKQMAEILPDGLMTLGDFIILKVKPDLEIMPR